MPTLNVKTSPASPTKAPPEFPSLWVRPSWPLGVYLIVRRDTKLDAPRMPADAPVDYSLVAVPLGTAANIDLQAGVDLAQFTPFVGTVTLESK